MKNVAEGMKPIYVHIDERVFDELQRFRKARGEKINAVVQAALIRHLQTPPPPPPRQRSALPQYPLLPPVEQAAA